MSAPLSPAERARLDEFEARPAAEEACVEQVARAMYERMGGDPADWDGDDPNAALDREGYGQLAAAAIDAMRPAADATRADSLAALVRRQAAALATVEAAVAEWDTEYRGPLNRWATVNVLRDALADPRAYSESVRRVGWDLARCHICAAGSTSEGDTQDVIDAHKAHRAALAAGDDGQAAHPCPDCGCMCSPAEAMCWRCGAVQPEEGQS